MNLKTTIKTHSTPGIGKAVFATSAIKNGETIIKSQRVKTVAKRDKYSLELNGEHLIINEPGVLINHSCAPNCKLQPNAAGAFDFIACRDIKKGEEITFDYETNESEIVAFNQCNCRVPQCRRQMNTAQQIIT